MPTASSAPHPVSPKSAQVRLARARSLVFHSFCVGASLAWLGSFTASVASMLKRCVESHVHYSQILDDVGNTLYSVQRTTNNVHRTRLGASKYPCHRVHKIASSAPSHSKRMHRLMFLWSVPDYYMRLSSDFTQVPGGAAGNPDGHIVVPVPAYMSQLCPVHYLVIISP